MSTISNPNEFTSPMFIAFNQFFGDYRIKDLKIGHEDPIESSVSGKITYQGKVIAEFNDDGFGGGLDTTFRDEEKQRLFYAQAEEKIPEKARVVDGYKLYDSESSVADCYLEELIRHTDRIKMIKRSKAGKNIAGYNSNSLVKDEFGLLDITLVRYWVPIKDGKSNPVSEDIFNKISKNLQNKEQDLIFIFHDLKNWKQTTC
jgi:hypothetical protein